MWSEKENEQELSIDTRPPDTKDLLGEDEKSIEEIDESGEKTNFRPKSIFNEKGRRYKIYTDQFDEVIKAEKLENREELERLRATLDQQLLQLKTFVSKLALGSTKLQIENSHLTQPCSCWPKAAYLSYLFSA